jgi:hypothetical protein
MSFGLPALAETLLRGLEEIAEVQVEDDGVRITTHCMYPSHGLVQVTVRGGPRVVVVSDEGGALGEAESAGLDLASRKDGVLAHLVAAQGLRIKGGVISSPAVPIESASMAVLLVANASKEVAQWLYEHARIKRPRDFRLRLASFLKATFENRVVHDEKIIGASNKPHKFANVIILGEEKRLIIDPVAKDPASINARVVANLDVRTSKNPNIIQRIVYDDAEKWLASDLNLIQIGAPVVPFSRSEDVIKRIASGG